MKSVRKAVQAEGSRRRGATGLWRTGGRGQGRAEEGEAGGWACEGWSGGARGAERPLPVETNSLVLLLQVPEGGVILERGKGEQGFFRLEVARELDGARAIVTHLARVLPASLVQSLRYLLGCQLRSLERRRDLFAPGRTVVGPRLSLVGERFRRLDLLIGDNGAFAPFRQCQRMPQCAGWQVVDHRVNFDRLGCALPLPQPLANSNPAPCPRPAPGSGPHPVLHPEHDAPCRLRRSVLVSGKVGRTFRENVVLSRETLRYNLELCVTLRT